MSHICQPGPQFQRVSSIGYLGCSWGRRTKVSSEGNEGREWSRQEWMCTFIHPSSDTAGEVGNTTAILQVRQ